MSIRKLRNFFGSLDNHRATDHLDSSDGEEMDYDDYDDYDGYSTHLYNGEPLKSPRCGGVMVTKYVVVLAFVMFFLSYL